MQKLNTADMIVDEQVIVLMTQTGYIKRSPIESYRKTARGAKGVIGAMPDDGDTVIKIFPASTHDWLLAFTNKGTVHWLKVYDIPESARATKGRALVNLIGLKEEERVTSIIPISGEFDEAREIVFGTAEGLVKKTKLSEYGNPRNGGIVAIKLDGNDALIGAALTDGSKHIMLITECGQSTRVKETEIGSQGRNTAGRRGIKLKLPNDHVCALLALDPEDTRYVLTFTKGGIGKRTLAADYPVYHCGSSGVATSVVAYADRSSWITTGALVTDKDDVVIVSNQGKTVRIPTDHIRISDRRTKGVKLINLEDGQEVVSAAVLNIED
jgi:DNA gyrase subunit A